MESSKGELILLIKEARLTHDTELLGSMDPYVVVKIDKIEQKTKVIPKGGKNPKWNEKLLFNAHEGDKVEIQVWDKEDLKADDFVGEGFIIIKPNLYSVKQSIVVPLIYGKKNDKAGDVLIEIEFVQKQKEEQVFKKALERTQTEINEYQQKYENLLRENQDIKERYSEKTKELNDKNIELQNIQEEYKLYKNELIALRQEKDTLQTSISAEKEKNIQLLKEFNERFLSELSKMTNEQNNILNENKNLLETIKLEKDKQHQLLIQVDEKKTELGQKDLEIERIKDLLAKEKEKNQTLSNELQEKDNEKQKLFNSKEQIELKFNQEQSINSEYQKKLESLNQALSLEKDHTIEALKEGERKDKQLLDLAEQKDRLSSDLLVENKQNSRYIIDIQNLTKQSIDQNKLIEELRADQENKTNEIVLLKKEIESTKIELSSEKEKSERLDTEIHRLTDEARRIAEEKERLEKKSQETTNIFKQNESIFNMNFLKQLEAKKLEVQNALTENERLAAENKIAKEDATDMFAKFNQKANELSEKSKECEKLLLDILTLKQQKSDLERELVETRGEKDTNIIELTKEKERNIQFLQELKQTEGEVAMQKERVIQALKDLEKKNEEISILIANQNAEKTALLQDLAKLQSSNELIQKLEQDVLRERENYKESIREIEKKSNEIVNIHKEKEDLLNDLGKEKENNGKLSGEIQKLHAENKTNEIEKNNAEEELNRSKKGFSDFLRLIEQKAGDIQELVKDKMK